MWAHVLSECALAREIIESLENNFRKVDYVKYIEIGIGNRWFVRTETENKDGTEFEERGIIKPIYFESLYVRIWFRKTCFIFDTKEGFKKVSKTRDDYKFIVGIVSRLKQ